MVKSVLCALHIRLVCVINSYLPNATSSISHTNNDTHSYLLLFDRLSLAGQQTTRLQNYYSTALIANTDVDRNTIVIRTLYHNQNRNIKIS